MANINIDKKSIAKALYVQSGYTQEEIAEKVGVTRQTVGRWVKAEGWEELKASQTITPAQIIAQFNRQIVEINNKISEREVGQRFATPQEADAINKLASSINKLQNEVGIADIVSVGMRFLTWLRPLDPEAGKTFNNLFDTFIKEVAR
ncbi:MAG: helix-turn-helix domain-containing protein [Bacteroidales bacterium]|nr:helix-turn-helix domain-containing protein [Bacteroidales bacterium]